ncbi:unnamed protein product [Ostreobium quekettii]|uniref:BTB domain-containing protein n=1 Tax=Ostreobium quekettii TaxID=121088 RepID=A0A8S1J030_9CHLO|nr:unnamed protein product [Ostreobium quekettii]
MQCEDKDFALGCLGSVFNDASGSDVTIRGPDGREVHCHRVFLSAASKVFRQMFASGMAESSAQVVEVGEVDPGALEAMLRFIYTGSCGITDASLVPLTAIADRFDVSALTTLCARYADKHLAISEATCWDLLESAVAYGVAPVARRASQFVLKRMPPEDDGWVRLSEPGLEALTRAALQELAHYKVILAIERWIEHDRARRLDHGLAALKQCSFYVLTLDELARVSALRVVCDSPPLRNKVFQSISTIGKMMQQFPRIRAGAPEAATVAEWREPGAAGIWTALTSGRHFILAKGGEGGSIRLIEDGREILECGRRSGGRGAVVGGSFELRQGDRLVVSVGARGTGGAGGGGSYVMMAGSKEGGGGTGAQRLLVAAGGGGGAGWRSAGLDAEIEAGEAGGCSLGPGTGTPRGLDGGFRAAAFRARGLVTGYRGNGDAEKEREVGIVPGGCLSAGLVLGVVAGEGEAGCGFATPPPAVLRGGAARGGGVGGSGGGGGGSPGGPGGAGGEGGGGGGCFVADSAENVAKEVRNFGHGMVKICLGAAPERAWLYS